MTTRECTADDLRKAREVLSIKGWSQRSAAPALGVSYQHLNMVLRGHRGSRRILEDIHHLPLRSLAPAGNLYDIRIGKARKGGDHE